MDNLISKISEIESAASAIMDSANEKKQQLAADMAAKTAAFDEELEKETSEELERLRSSMKQELEKQLEAERASTDALIVRLQESYDKHHVKYVQELFEQMVKG